MPLEPDLGFAEETPEGGEGASPRGERTVPEKIDHYPIKGSLGIGGMGEVFLAYDSTLERGVALKRMRPDRILDPIVRRRFDVEARVTAFLQHPSIIPVYEYKKEQDNAYYTMRPVEGLTLGDVLEELRDPKLKRGQRWSTARLLRLFLQAANAVAYAHSKGVIHRDLKPENIMIGPFEEVLVLDWGMAKFVGETDTSMSQLKIPPSLTKVNRHQQHSTLVGTPSYMAPEQLRNEPATYRTDVFSLGIILYELLALRLPWPEGNFEDMLRWMREELPAPTRLQPSRGIPARLDDVCLRALSYHPNERYPSVSSFADEVADAIEGRARWESHLEGRERDRWHIADGRARVDGNQITLTSRGQRRSFRYFYQNRLSDNVRVEFDLKVKRGRHTLKVWLNAELDENYNVRRGYSVTIIADHQRLVSLKRSGREVAGAMAPELEPKRWYRVVVERYDDRISLKIGRNEVYSYRDPIPLHGGLVGLSGLSDGVQLRRLEVSSRGSDAAVSCLSIPDAFYNRGFFDDARAEYRKIADSQAGRTEGRLAEFRAGLCLLELARRARTTERRVALVEQAARDFSPRPDEQSCLMALGHTIVASERRDFDGVFQSLSRALIAFPNDPHISTVHEWVLGRLHSLRPDRDRRLVAEILPLALTHLTDDWGRRIVRECVARVQRTWETPSFFTRRSKYRDGDLVNRAETQIFLGFWSGRAEIIVRAVRDLFDLDKIRSFHLADSCIALIELGHHDCAQEFCEAAREWVGATTRFQSVTTLVETILAAISHEVDKAEFLLSSVEEEPLNRAYNTARLWLARSGAELGDEKLVFRSLRRQGPRDFFAREHRAWYGLYFDDPKFAEKELRPFITRGDHLKDRNLCNFLYGLLLLKQNRPGEASKVFSAAESVLFPRTWTLGSYIAGGQFEGEKRNKYLERCFPWEAAVFKSHEAFFEHVIGSALV